ncbi:MAG: Ada metal-binding domain-containing protein [Cyclobacteriaceae bacterium]|nr:Ada metal-binding domain-containing protein [Cyclobacteriaceae bacterium]
MIRAHTIILAGNQSLKIYGTLRCRSGKRMKRTNRVFFKKETEALREGFRPCGHCMRRLYSNWIDQPNIRNGGSQSDSHR